MIEKEIREKNRHQTKSGPGRMSSRVKTQREDKVLAAKHGITSPARQYAARFSVDVHEIIQTQRQAQRR